MNVREMTQVEAPIDGVRKIIDRAIAQSRPDSVKSIVVSGNGTIMAFAPTQEEIAGRVVYIGEKTGEMPPNLREAVVEATLVTGVFEDDAAAFVNHRALVALEHALFLEQRAREAGAAVPTFFAVGACGNSAVYFSMDDRTEFEAAVARLMTGERPTETCGLIVRKVGSGLVNGEPADADEMKGPKIEFRIFDRFGGHNVVMLRSELNLLRKTFLRETSARTVKEQVAGAQAELADALAWVGGYAQTTVERRNRSLAAMVSFLIAYDIGKDAFRTARFVIVNQQLRGPEIRIYEAKEATDVERDTDKICEAWRALMTLQPTPGGRAN